jgi:hypothetical protein
MVKKEHEGAKSMTSNRLVLGTGTMLCMGILLIAQLARAEDHILKGRLTACPSDKTVIGGVNACGKVWALRSGEVELGGGKLEVELHGLVLNDASVGSANGSPDGVDAVVAALVCHATGGASVVAQTEPVALSAKGDAKINAKLDLPKQCFGPAILVRERYEGKIGGWLAATGY